SEPISSRAGPATAVSVAGAIAPHSGPRVSGTRPDSRSFRALNVPGLSKSAPVAVAWRAGSARPGRAREGGRSPPELRGGLVQRFGGRLGGTDPMAWNRTTRRVRRTCQRPRLEHLETRCLLATPEQAAIVPVPITPVPAQAAATSPGTTAF